MFLFMFNKEQNVYYLNDSHPSIRSISTPKKNKIPYLYVKRKGCDI